MKHESKLSLTAHHLRELIKTAATTQEIRDGITESREIFEPLGEEGRMWHFALRDYGMSRIYEISKVLKPH